MPSKKRKYNARFPAGRIKKIMQTDEEVGKVAQAVPIIISRTLELFVESLLSKALQVTTARNAKTLSPSHVKQCILAESRFDFLKDLVANIPDVSAAEEKEMMSAEDSPNSSRFSDTVPRRLAREDSNSSSSSEIRQRVPREMPPRSISLDPEIHRHRPEVTSTIVSADTVIDLSKKSTESKVRANFYQETLPDEVHQTSVITPNPTYSQPSTSNFIPKSEVKPTKFYIDIPTLPTRNNNTPPVTPVLNIDFSKSLGVPEIKVLSPLERPKLQRQNSKPHKEVKKLKPPMPRRDSNSGNLQIDEDYDT